MVSIPKAFHSFEKKEMTVSEYEKYLKEHQYHNSLRALRCIECGDILTYCKGDHNVPYFKHSPTHNGHGYCSLYHEGKESKTDEALLRKKFFMEEDISLNYELLYREGKWQSLLTIPPFKSEEIQKNEDNKTTILIENQGKKNKIFVDKKHFLAGEIKHVMLGNFSKCINITINGNSTKQDIFYKMDGFIPNEQLYTSLVLQKYIQTSKDDKIDLSNLKFFACKRISGHVFTGRHYILFSNLPNFHLRFINNKSIEMKRINLIIDKDFKYDVYDVVFNLADDLSIKFCNERNCELVEKDDALIIWPPIKTVGNYHYYENHKTSMFILFENDAKALDIYSKELFNKKNERMYLFFKIKNINERSFYVTLDKRKLKDKENANIDTVDIDKINLKDFKLIYVLNNNVVLSEYDPYTKISKNNSLILMNTQLDKEFAFNNHSTKSIYISLINAIRYTREYINFSDKYIKYLEDIYKEDLLISNYIKHCKQSHTIKKKALELLLNEVK